MNASKPSISDLSLQLFWDIKPGNIRLDKNRDLIVERVIQRGSRSDLKTLLNAYSRQELVESTKRIAYLNPKDMAFVHIFFDIPYSEMKCYTKRQSARRF